jgi:hypothetical protein
MGKVINFSSPVYFFEGKLAVGKPEVENEKKHELESILSNLVFLRFLNFPVKLECL